MNKWEVIELGIMEMGDVSMTGIEVKSEVEVVSETYQ
jgi:hypothetical protein